jgi:hypothetical protein
MKPTTGTFTDIFDRAFAIPPSTAMEFCQRLRQDESLFRRGKRGQGALALTTAELANWTTALCAATARTRQGPCAIETVKLARAAVRLSEPGLDARCPAAALEGLAIGQATTFGEAFEGLIEDMRSGAFRAWKGDRPAYVTLRFFNCGARIVVNFWRLVGDGTQEAVIVFRHDDHPGERGLALVHVNELDGIALEMLAAALDPPS